MIVWLQEHLGYGAFMRLVTYAAVLFVSLSGGALAQNSDSGGTNTGMTKHEARSTNWSPPTYVEDLAA